MWSDDYQIGSDWDINSGGRTAALRKLKKVHRKQSDIISLIGLISTANIMLFGWEANVASHLIKEKSIAIISPAIVVKGEMFFSCILLYLRSCITYRAERNTNTSVSHFLESKESKYWREQRMRFISEVTELCETMARLDAAQSDGSLVYFLNAY